MNKIVRFPQLKPPNTLEQLRRRILADCEDIEMGATSASRGASLILDDIVFFLNQIGVNTEKN